MALWINDGLHEAAADIHSFLLVGQSNMARRGDLTKENAITAPDCFMPSGSRARCCLTMPCFRQGWHSVLLRLRRFYGIRVRATALHRNSWKPTPNSFSARCRRSGKNSAICPSWWANWAGRKTAFTEHPQNCCTNSTVVCRSGQRSCPGVP